MSAEHKKATVDKTLRCPDCNGPARDKMLRHEQTCPVLAGLARDTAADAEAIARRGDHWLLREVTATDLAEMRVFDPGVRQADVVAFVYFVGFRRVRRILARSEADEFLRGIWEGGDPR